MKNPRKEYYFFLGKLGKGNGEIRENVRNSELDGTRASYLRKA